MRIKIFYYSYTGNTQKVSQQLQEFLINRGCQANLERILCVDESSSFFKQGMRAFLKKSGQIAPLDLADLQGWDWIGLGFPVWAFSLPPGVRGFLEKLPPLPGKKVFIFVTFGSGAGKTKALDEAEKLLNTKGYRTFYKMGIPSSKIEDKDWLDSQFEGLYQILAP